MKHITKMICACIICFLLGFFVFGSYIKNVVDKKQLRKQKQEESYLYKYMGKEFDQFSPNDKESINEEGRTPSESVQRLSAFGGIIPDAETAVKVGTAVLSSIFGGNETDLQKPFKVELIIDKIWHVYGTPSKRHIGGTLEIYIQKSDSRILNINNSK